MNAPACIFSTICTNVFLNLPPPKNPKDRLAAPFDPAKKAAKHRFINNFCANTDYKRQNSVSLLRLDATAVWQKARGWPRMEFPKKE
ncbi:MAG: hypothetical protein V1492_01055 [Candidatus Micrarchaeota archaeon]